MTLSDNTKKIQGRADIGASRRGPAVPTYAGFVVQRMACSFSIPCKTAIQKGHHFVGFAASFPAADNDTPIDYVVNTVYWQEEVES